MLIEHISECIVKYRDYKIKSTAYSIFSAIRGCDWSGLEEHKMFFTARIRYWLFGDDCGGWVRKGREFSEKDFDRMYSEIEKIVTSLVAGEPVIDRDGYDIYNHYLYHIIDALMVIIAFINKYCREMDIYIEVMDICEEAKLLLNVAKSFKQVAELIRREEFSKARCIFDEIKSWLTKKGYLYKPLGAVIGGKSVR